MAIERRYQVFVSSTYQDLYEERQEVMQALLELDCIPSGMELFPAANDDQWTLIKRVIDDCDYYIVIVAGRYGSTSSEGVSYTEMEYRYALSKNKPIIGFVHKDPLKIPASKYETDPEKQQKLLEFRNLAQEKLVKFWETPRELGSVVSRSLIRLIKDNPAIGWVRGDNISSDAAREEILNLKRRIEEFEEEASRNLKIDAGSYDLLARGADEVSLDFILTVSEDRSDYFGRTNYRWQIKSTWEEIFYNISPDLIDEASASKIGSVLASRFGDKDRANLLNFCEKRGVVYKNFSVTDESLNISIVQFTALGLLHKGQKRRPIQDKSSYWGLSLAGEKYMYELRAIRRS